MASRKSLFNRFSGKLGNVVLYTRYGKEFVRVCPARVKNPRTELQMFYRARLRMVNMFYSVIRESPLVRIWRLAAREVNTGSNLLFYKMNIRAFNGDKGFFYDRLHFTVGSLPLAEGMRVSRLSANEVLLSWENAVVLSEERKKDGLLVVAMMANALFDVFLPERVGCCREDGKVVLRLPEKAVGAKYLYCAFLSAEGDKCSCNQYLEIPDSAESDR